MVRLSVCHDREPCKDGWTDRDAVWDVDFGVPREPCIRLRPEPHAKGQFWGGKGRPIVKYRDSLQWAVQKWKNPLWCRLGCGLDPRDHVSDGVYIGATWRIRLNRPCATAMQPYVKLLWPFVKYGMWYCNTFWTIFLQYSIAVPLFLTDSHAIAHFCCGLLY